MIGFLLSPLPPVWFLFIVFLVPTLFLPFFIFSFSFFLLQSSGSRNRVSGTLDGGRDSAVLRPGDPIPRQHAGNQGCGSIHEADLPGLPPRHAPSHHQRPVDRFALQCFFLRKRRKLESQKKTTTVVNSLNSPPPLFFLLLLLLLLLFFLFLVSPWFLLLLYLLLLLLLLYLLLLLLLNLLLLLLLLPAADPNCEIDPTRLEPGENASENLTTLLYYVNKVLIAIVSSAAACPVKMRKLFASIRRCATERFPGLPV